MPWLFRHAPSCIQPLHVGVLMPSIGHFATVEVILTQTISRLSISLFQTTTLEPSSKTRMQTSWQVYWREKELRLYVIWKLSVLNLFAKLSMPFPYSGSLCWNILKCGFYHFRWQSFTLSTVSMERGSFPVVFREWAEQWSFNLSFTLANSFAYVTFREFWDKNYFWRLFGLQMGPFIR